MFLTPTSAQEVYKCIKSLDNKKSNNIYGMSTKFLKVIFKSVSEVLRNSFIESFSQGIFPDHMKLALVTLVYKGKSTLEFVTIDQYPYCQSSVKSWKNLLKRLTGFLEKK